MTHEQNAELSTVISLIARNYTVLYCIFKLQGSKTSILSAVHTSVKDQTVYQSNLIT